MSIRSFLKDDFKFIVFSNEFNLAFSSAKKRRTAMNILESAINCIARSGFQNTTLKMISRDSGISETTISDCFQSIDHLKVQVVKYIRVLYQSYVVSQLESLESFEKLFDKYIYCCFQWPKYFPKHSSVWISYMHLCALDDSLRAINSEAVKIGYDRLKFILAKAKTEGIAQFEDLDEVASQIHKMITGYLLSQATELNFDVKKMKQEIKSACYLILMIN